MKHYVYKITDIKTNEFYIGSRSCKCNPINDSYMGSMKQWKPTNVDNLVKEIIKSDFTNRDEAILYESNLISQVINHKLNRNYHIPTQGFHVSGLSKTDEQRKYLSKIRIDKELSKGTNNPMYSKKHSVSAINKMKEKATGRYTLEWYMDKYGKDEGRFLYETKNKTHSNRMSGKSHPRYGKYGIDNPMYGRVVSDDTKRKISKTKSKKILQFSTDGIFIKEWDTVKDAATHYDIHINTIYNNLMGKRPNGNGYLWKYGEK